jgi:hypothetical protein
MGSRLKESELVLGTHAAGMGRKPIRGRTERANDGGFALRQPTLIASTLPFRVVYVLTFIFVFVMHYHFNVVAALPRSTTAADQARL